MNKTWLISEKISDCLVRIVEILADRVSWAVDGSCALALQGVDVFPHDVDILTDKSSAYEIGEIMSEFVERSVQYGETPRWRSHFGVMKMNSIKIEIMGDLQSFRNGKWSDIQNPGTVPIDLLLINDIKIPVVSISYLNSSGYMRERMSRE